MFHEAANPLAMLGETSGEPLEGSESAGMGQLAPIGQSPSGPALAPVGEERAELLLEDVCRADGLVGGKEPVEFLAAVGIEFLVVAQNQITLALDELPVLLAGPAALGAAHFVDGMVDVHHQMEPVIDDVRVGKPSLDGGLIGSGTVDADRLDAGPLFFGQSFEEGFHAFLLPALLHVEQFAGFPVEDDGDVTVALADRLLVDEEFGHSVQTRGRRIRLQDDLVIAAHRGVADLEHRGDLGIGRQSSPRADQSHQPPGGVTVGMNLPRTGRRVAVARPAEALHGGERQIHDGAMRHGTIHHGPAADLVAGKLFLAAGTSGAGTLVEIEVDLRPDFLEFDPRNDIPLEGSQRLDISDFHTRSRPSRQGDVTSRTIENRHALTTKSLFYPESWLKTVPFWTDPIHNVQHPGALVLDTDSRRGINFQFQRTASSS